MFSDKLSSSPLPASQPLMLRSSRLRHEDLSDMLPPHPLFQVQRLNSESASLQRLNSNSLAPLQRLNSDPVPLLQNNNPARAALPTSLHPFGSSPSKSMAFSKAMTSTSSGSSQQSMGAAERNGNGAAAAPNDADQEVAVLLKQLSQGKGPKGRVLPPPGACLCVSLQALNGGVWVV